MQEEEKTYVTTYSDEYLKDRYNGQNSGYFRDDSF